MSALSSIARLSIGMTMSVPSHLGVASDVPSSTPTLSAVSSLSHSRPPPIGTPALGSRRSVENQLPHHRCSFPSVSASPALLHTFRSTGAIQAWPFNRDRVVEISPGVKNSPPTDGICGRRVRSLLLPRLIGCLGSGGSADDDITPDMTSLADRGLDGGNYFLERPPAASASGRKLDGSADVHASSPINSSGVHIVIDAGNDSDDVTSGDEVVIFVGDDEECSSDRDDAPTDIC